MEKNQNYENNTEKYKKIYKDLVTSRKTRGLNKKELDFYTEKHHIIPRCLGGTDDADNLVLLTYREHIIAHMLLSRIYEERLELSHVVSLMYYSPKNDILSKEGVRITTRMLEELKIKSLKYLQEEKGIVGQLGVRFSEEKRKKMSDALKGHKNSDHAKKLMSKIHSRPIKGPDGKEYDSIAACAKETGFTRRQIEYYLKNKPSMGFSYVKDSTKIKKVIDPNGVIFPSLRQCGIAYKRDGKTIKNWIENFPEMGFKYYEQ